MSDQESANRIRTFCDGELESAEHEAFEARTGAEADVAARVRYERTLKERVDVVMRGEASAAPPALREQVVRAMSEPVRTLDAGTDTETATATATAADTNANAAAGDEPIRRSWLTGPTRANVYAVAATLALITGAVLFGIFGRPIDTLSADSGSSLVSGRAPFEPSTTTATRL